MSRAKIIDLEVIHTRTFQRPALDPFEVRLMAALVPIVRKQSRPWSSERELGAEGL